MKPFLVANVLSALTWCASACGAADLTTIPRVVQKEPAYSGSPRYCLLVFGPEAKTRVWAVLDGDVLYVDRNANGDLTEPGEKVEAQRFQERRTFEVGTILDGARSHTHVTVSTTPLAGLDVTFGRRPEFSQVLKRRPDSRACVVSAEVSVPDRRGSGPEGRVVQLCGGSEFHGILLFADRPADAPILHFGGPWSLTLHGPYALNRNARCELFLGFGTPGLGSGAFTFVSYASLVPDGVYPVAELTLPARSPGDSPNTERYTLKERC
jgi:hypothetical protein